MTKEELIVKQQLEIESLKEKTREFAERLEDIRLSMYCIGGPLNDNVLEFTSKQKEYLSSNVGEVAELSEEEYRKYIEGVHG